MGIRKSRILFLAAATIPIGVFATTYTWSNTSGGSWDLNTNWTPSSAFPNAVDDTAIFGNSIAAASTIHFSNSSPANITIGRIDFNPSSFMYTVQSVHNPQTLTFQSSSGNSQLNVKSGAQDVFWHFNAGALITVDLANSLDCNIGAGRTLTFRIPNFTGIGNTLHLSGDGTLLLEGSVGVIQPTILLERGVLELNMNSGQLQLNSVLLNGGTMKNLNSNQIGLSNTPTDVTLNGGTWNMNGFADNVHTLTFFSGSLTGNSVQLGIGDSLVMRNTTLNGDISFAVSPSFTIVFDSANGGTATINGNVIHTGPLTFDIASGNRYFDMIVSGSVQGNTALSKTGNGTLLFEGANTQTGGISVSSGALLVGAGGSIADQTITVSSGAIFGGVGTVGTAAAVVNNSGTLSPGLSPGVFTINGTYTQTGTGRFSEELLTRTNSDKLIVNTGAVNLAGALDVTLLPDQFLFGKSTLTIIDNSAGSGVSGTFSTVNRIGFPTDTFMEVIYQPNEVQLSLFVPDAQALSPGNITAPVLSQICQNTLNFTRHLQKIRPLCIKKHSECVTFNEANEMGNSDSLVASSTININFTSHNEEGPVYRSPFSKSTSAATYISLAPQNTWGVFADAIGSLGRVYSSSVNYAYRYYNVGALAGFDYVGENYAVGVSPGYEFLEAKALNDNSKFTIQSAEATLFATYIPFSDLNLFVDLIGGGAYQWYHFQRNTPDGTVHGKPKGGEWNVYSDIGYTFEASSFLYSSDTSTPLITPWVGLGYMGATVGSFHESGSLLQVFEIDDQTIQSLRTSLGFSVNYLTRWERFSFFPEARISWQREYLNHSRDISFTHLPEIDSEVPVQGLGRNTVFAGVLLRLLFKDRVDLYGSYDYEWNSQFHSNLFLVGSEYRF